MSDCRDQATHRTFKRAIKLTVGSSRIPHDEFEVGASMYPADDLVRRFARDAESWFRQFCALPSELVPARFISVGALRRRNWAWCSRHAKALTRARPPYGLGGHEPAQSRAADQLTNG
jgi:hypothetical protein